MKVRNSFVSNSSSMSYILDLRDDGVREAVEFARERGIGAPMGLGRGTAIAVGHRAVEYAKQWKAEMGEWDTGYGDWIIEHALDMGTDNIVFARDSDEGMGGRLPFNAHRLAVSEREYH
jgi:hypothetical protein